MTWSTNLIHQYACRFTHVFPQNVVSSLPNTPTYPSKFIFAACSSHRCQRISITNPSNLSTLLVQESTIRYIPPTFHVNQLLMVRKKWRQKFTYCGGFNWHFLTKLAALSMQQFYSPQSKQLQYVTIGMKTSHEI